MRGRSLVTVFIPVLLFVSCLTGCQTQKQEAASPESEPEPVPIPNTLAETVTQHYASQYGADKIGGFVTPEGDLYCLTEAGIWLVRGTEAVKVRESVPGSQHNKQMTLDEAMGRAYDEADSLGGEVTPQGQLYLLTRGGIWLVAGTEATKVREVKAFSQALHATMPGQMERYLASRWASTSYDLGRAQADTGSEE